ncbi:filamentous hemagglutinin N-terminal domain-containing protein [Xenorhabdus sp. 12]|uniref:Filamentous hemagglutinin N-terminal domain-containing protein n=1 Tax=Xenorhabdus santafensis TaxID=2582833 RepID=A0ABU4S9Q6_9GAMM|nr:filamentous hemagglutinin N-terminal domain-containing protein [Xenorhabdus sp. 12]MDX7987505.1 filamentous hemagglutinin N-terminal domain-containing protein [Xenorhabdus sp. 12]
MKKINKTKFLSKTILGCLISFTSMSSSFANPIIPDDGNTQVNQINNVPVVNIANPDEHGRSYNNYKEFNIGSQGAVLNNSLSDVNSQLAGQLDKNANLTKAARVIINDVVGSNESQILGALEVAGEKASVIISNQNGIIANGARFTNMDSISLHTGIPARWVDGSSYYFVRKGTITIGENGLNGEGVKRVTLKSRFLDINGKINGDYIFLRTGANKADDDKSRPAIDTKELGGVYGNQIFIKSSESGFGVNLENIEGTEFLRVLASGPTNLSGPIKSGGRLIISAPTINEASNLKLETGSGSPDLTLEDPNIFGPLYPILDF